jgi:hypothetical protein
VWWEFGETDDVDVYIACLLAVDASLPDQEAAPPCIRLLMMQQLIATQLR